MVITFSNRLLAFICVTVAGFLLVRCTAIVLVTDFMVRELAKKGIHTDIVDCVSVMTILVFFVEHYSHSVS